MTNRDTLEIDVDINKLGNRKSMAMFTGGSIRNILKRGVKPAQINAKAKKIFESVDADGSGFIDAVEMRRLLKSWGITGIDHNSLVDMFVQDPNEKRKPKALNISEFDNFMTFFFSVREEFESFPKKSSTSISLSELPKFLAKIGYNLNINVMSKFLELFDYDKSGELEFNEILSLLLYLNRLESHYENEDTDADNSLDEKELQSLLRTLHINTKIEEIRLIMEELGPTAFVDLNFDSFVELFFKIKNNLHKVKDRANALRAKNKQKPFKRKVAIEQKDQLKQAMAREKTKIDAIIQHCKSTGKKWSDPDFPPNASSLFKDPKEVHRNKLAYQWLRPSDIAPGAALFVDGVEEGDVIQGRIGNCYLLSALCVLACTDDLIETLILDHWPDYGIYLCRFYKNQQWHLVTVDDQIPVDEYNLVFFGQCRDAKEYWVQIIEKAYAKLHGSYGAIEHGVISDALVDLTGEPAELITPIVDTDELWNKLCGYIEEGYLMGCNIESEEGDPNEPTELGLLKNHAYGVLDIQEVEGHRLLRLRNPWGSHEWTGPWSDGSCEWTEELLDHFHFEFGDDGTFFMEFHDFCEHFTHFIVLRAMGARWTKNFFNGEWKSPTTAGGCVNHPTWMHNPQLKIKSPMTRKIFAALSHDDGRLRTKGDYTYPSAGITVIRRKDDSSTLQESLESRSEIVAVTKFICTREASVSFTAEANQPYTLILSTYNPNIEGRWYSMVATLGAAEVIELNQRKPSTNQIKGEWVGVKAAGCCDWNSWRNGTQYFLIVREAGEKTVTLVQSRRQKLLQIGYYIFPANPEKLPTLDKDTKLHVCNFLDSATVSNSYHLDRGLYVILPCTFRPEHENQYGLVVQGAGCELVPIPSEWFRHEISGQWTATLCGGCGNAGNKDYVKNPIIHFSIHENSVLYIVLQIEEYSEIKGIGFYLFTSDETGTLGTRLDRSDFKTEKEVVKRFEQPAGDYAILPVTYTKGVQGPWRMLVYSTHQLNLRQVNK